jgi:hypothetical protein
MMSIVPRARRKPRRLGTRRSVTQFDRERERWLFLAYRLWKSNKRHIYRFPALPSPDGGGATLKTLPLPATRDPATSQEKLPPETVFTQLARLAKVSELERAERLRHCVAFDLKREWQHWYSLSRTNHRESERQSRKDHDDRKRAHAQLGYVAKLLSQLDSSLREFNEYARSVFLLSSFELYLQDREDSPFPRGTFVQNNHEFIAIITRVIARALHYARPKPSPPRPKGRPFRPVSWGLVPGSLSGFTLRLLWDVRTAGGHLTLDKNSAKGTLPEALNLLRPHLPPGFVPQRLPVSTLQRIKTLDQIIAPQFVGAENIWS